MKYKVGDKVRIVKRKIGDMQKRKRYGEMDKYLNTIMTIESVVNDYYKMKEDDGAWRWYDYMIEMKVTTVKDMLKTGDIVVLRMGRKYLVLKGGFDTYSYGKQELMFVSNHNGFMQGDGYNDDLTYKSEWGGECQDEFDIMEIRRGGVSSIDNTFQDAKTIWKRDEDTPIQKKLKELEEKQREIADEIKNLREKI